MATVVSRHGLYRRPLAVAIPEQWPRSGSGAACRQEAGDPVIGHLRRGAAEERALGLEGAPVAQPGAAGAKGAVASAVLDLVPQVRQARLGAFQLGQARIVSQDPPVLEVDQLEAGRRPAAQKRIGNSASSMKRVPGLRPVL